MPTKKTAKKSPRKNPTRGRPALGKPGTYKPYTFLIPVKDINKLRSIAKKSNVSVSSLLRTATENIIAKH